MPDALKEAKGFAAGMQEYKSQLEQELNSIINYWEKNTVDPLGGFYGKITQDNSPDPLALKGVVLNSRILWTFSKASKFNSNPACLQLARKAFEYILGHFIDKKYGGVYWTVDHHGNIADGKKQIYGLAFCIYGMSAYFSATADRTALDMAKALYDTIELHSRDQHKGGYFEAFTREWMQIEDLRLSAKDSNEKKTMNTHLHILEAYSQLYRVWQNEKLKEDIRALIWNFLDQIIDPSTGHLRLFFDEDWNVKGDIISYGHDIEASWLLLEAAETIKDEKLVTVLKENALKMSKAAEEGVDIDGGLWYEIENGHLIMEKHSWPQAEAMVGFFNAGQVSGDNRFYDLSRRCWEFTRRYIIDYENGEWYWGVEKDNIPMKGMDKVGIWKCPYHNSRACMELIQRISTMFSSYKK